MGIKETAEGVELSPHVVRIAEQMAPDPSKWRLSHIDHSGEEFDRCTCGAPIKWRFHIVRKNDCDSEDKLIIGSVCIVETVPWLMMMNAEDLAIAIETQWKQVVEERQQERRDKAGMKKLKPALSLAAALDRWFWDLGKVLFDNDVRNLPSYWLDYKFKPEKRLLAAKGSTPGRHASSLNKRIETFIGSVEMLREVMRYAGKPELWVDPPTSGPADVDTWYEIWIGADRLFAQVKAFQDAHETLLARCFPELYNQIEAVIKALMPVESDELRTWIASTSSFVETFPSEAALAEALERYTIASDRRDMLKNDLAAIATRLRVHFPEFVERVQQYRSSWEGNLEAIQKWIAEVEVLLTEAPDEKAIAAAEAELEAAKQAFADKKAEVQEKARRLRPFAGAESIRAQSFLNHMPRTSAAEMRAWCAEADELLATLMSDEDIDERERRQEEARAEEQRERDEKLAREQAIRDETTALMKQLQEISRRFWEQRGDYWNEVSNCINAFPRPHYAGGFKSRRRGGWGGPPPIRPSLESYSAWSEKARGVIAKCPPMENEQEQPASGNAD